MKSSPSIKFLMMMQSNCPIFQWGEDVDLFIFEQISMSISGFFGAFDSLIYLMQGKGLLSKGEQLDNVKFEKTRIFFRDNDIFQSIYVVEAVGLRNKKAIERLIRKIDDEFTHMFGDNLKNWDHNIEPFKKFKQICEKFL